MERHGLFHWRRDLDLRPTGKPDVGRLRYVDASTAGMTEVGVEEPYVELWERVGAAEAPVALRLGCGDGRGKGPRGWFVAAGAHFVLATQGEGTAGLEVSHGRRDPGGANGNIVESSNPRRAAMRAFPADPLALGWTCLPV